MMIARRPGIWAGLTGIALGVSAVLLTHWGNPVDGGISITCFLRDIMGALRFHSHTELSYIRSEIIGIGLGATILAMVKGEFRPRGGSLSAVRFAIAMGCTIALFGFIGCPFRAGLRLAAGDPAALSALGGIVAGVLLHGLFLSSGVELPQAPSTNFIRALLFPGLLVLLLVLLFAHPAWLIMAGDSQAPAGMGLLLGATCGALAQHSRFCCLIGMRDLIFKKDLTLAVGIVGFLISAAVASFVFGQSHFGETIVGSPNHLWNFIAMATAGLGFSYLNGCPFRQLIRASEGDWDAAGALAGMAAGAVISYRFNLAYFAGSLELGGRIAIVSVCIGLLLMSAGWPARMPARQV